MTETHTFLFQVLSEYFYKMYNNFSPRNGPSMPQAVIRRGGGIRSQVSPCDISGVQGGTLFFLRVFQFLPCRIIPAMFHKSLIPRLSEGQAGVTWGLSKK